MTPEQAMALREPFPDSEIGKLPRVTCGDCRDRQDKCCSKHKKSKCNLCHNYITDAHIHLDYLGHAELTDRLIDVDPEWTWEPAAWTEHGTPAISKHRTNLVMWGRLTICGVTRPGVGTAPEGKDDAHKELIGDFLRNAGMRFGVALDLWRKSEKAEAEHPIEPVVDPLRAEVRAHIAEASPSVAEAWAAWWKDQGFTWSSLTDEDRQLVQLWWSDQAAQVDDPTRPFEEVS